MNKKIIGATSLLAAGLVAGSFFSISGANAADATDTTSAVTAPSTYPVDPIAATPSDTVDPTATTTTTPTKPAHTSETAVTGDLATELSDLALAKYPGATVDRVENDTDGDVYEVHLTLEDGSRVTVKFDANKAITSTETEPAFGGKGDGHHGPHGDNDGDRGDDNDGDGPDDAQTPSANNWTVTPLNG